MLAARLGAPSKDRYYRFYVSDQDHEIAMKLLGENGVAPEQKIIVLNPGGNWDRKRWPIGHYATLATRLYKETGSTVIVTGAPKDQSLGQDLITQSDAKVISLCGKTTLGELAAIMRRAALVVANDTGPMHIAASVDAPTIALFGPTDPVFTGPIGRNVRLIHQPGEMEAIGTELVYKQAKQLIS